MTTPSEPFPQNPQFQPPAQPAHFEQTPPPSTMQHSNVPYTQQWPQSPQATSPYPSAAPTPPKKNPTGLIAALSAIALILVLVIIGVLVFGFLRTNDGDTASDKTTTSPQEVLPPEQIFQGISAKFAESKSVQFAHVTPTHVSIERPRVDTPHVIVTGWDEAQAEVAVLDVSTNSVVPIGNTELDLTALGGHETDEGTLLVDLPDGTDTSGTKPPIVTNADAKALPVIINGTSGVVVQLSEGITGEPLITGIDASNTPHTIYKIDNDGACKLVDYSGNSEAQWVQDIDTSCDLVTSTETGEIVVFSLNDSGKIQYQTYGPSAEPAPTPTQEQLPIVIPADYIKQLDLANKYAPGVTSDNCRSIGNTTAPQLMLLPDQDTDCWLKLTNGMSDKIYTGPGVAGISSGDPVIRWGELEYIDIDEDGYLDATVSGGNGGGVSQWIFIFNPTDPEHPSAGGFFMGSDGGNLVFTDGAITVMDVRMYSKGTYTVDRDTNGHALLK